MEKVTASHRAIVFDLDDTLYLERDFAHSGFGAASIWFEERTGLADLEKECLRLFKAGLRSRVFDMAVDRVGGKGYSYLVPELVDLYRKHSPSISLASDADRYLFQSSVWKRALITDGFLQTQTAKIRALGLENRLDHLICTGAWGRGFWKPHPRAFERIEAWSGCRPACLAFVADNPTKDFVTPRARGWWTIQIARPERVHNVTAPHPAYDAHATISSLDMLNDCLADLDSAWRF